MRPLLFRPTDSTRTPEAAAGTVVASAIEELAGHFRAELRRAASESEEVSYDLLERAADGRLSDEEQVELDLVLEDDSQLRLELADLVALRGRLAPAANGRQHRQHRQHRQMAAWAIAALLLAAIGAQWAFDRPRDGESAGLSASAAAPASSQVLFRDDFESGDSSGWSN